MTEKEYPNTREKILADCKIFHDLTDTPYTRIGREGISDSRMIDRLQAGGTISVGKMDDLYAYMIGKCPQITHPIPGVITHDDREEKEGKTAGDAKETKRRGQRGGQGTPTRA